MVTESVHSNLGFISQPQYQSKAFAFMRFWPENLSEVPDSVSLSLPLPWDFSCFVLITIPWIVRTKHTWQLLRECYQIPQVLINFLFTFSCIKYHMCFYSYFFPLYSIELLNVSSFKEASYLKKKSSTSTSSCAYSRWLN